jgi:transposase
VQELVDIWYPNARKIVLIMDNLNTHAIGSLYEAFEPAEAMRIAKKLEIHYTPKHGSWLNMAEIELSVLSRECTGKPISNTEDLAREIAAWETRRNQNVRTVNWQFTTKDARVKLKQLYPSL